MLRSLIGLWAVAFLLIFLALRGTPYWYTALLVLLSLSAGLVMRASGSSKLLALTTSAVLTALTVTAYALNEAPLSLGTPYTYPIIAGIIATYTYSWLKARRGPG